MKNCILSLLLLLGTRCFGTVAITTTSLPNGTVSATYSAVANARNGCTPYKWTIASGALPPGVTAKASSTTTSLNFTGTPTTAATYSFTVKVTGCHGGTSQMAYKVVIQASANHVVDLSWNASTSSNVTGYNVYRSPDGTMWNASTSSNVTGYNLYRSPDGATWNKINASLIASTLYADSTVANGSTYYYAATAVDIYGNESSKTTPVKVGIP